ncbi:hypothetical protein GFL80_25545 [Rhizobium leguminosarum bv. viciae]|uniref:ATP-binding protein n=1 Tax=Rhizobium leguminosarum TaxID=384 RepID=UPI001441289C|nr:ATP-binding protein [Rhizobium leguminosarum]NKK87531.1 hypothetical protein [Rhizobium leguminosarum bv. viciae]
MSTITLKAKHDHLEKVASTRDPVKALAEFVWNALDADATEVSVEFPRNQLGAVEAIVIRDNGVGISKDQADHDFDSLGESWKRQARLTKVHARAIHGKEGQGRLKFHSWAQKALWKTVYQAGGTKHSLTISVDAGQLHTGTVGDPIAVAAEMPTGTVVELINLKEGLDWLTGEQARADFNATFAPYVLHYPGVAILYDGAPVDPTASIERSHDFRTKPVVAKTRVINDLSLKVIEWKNKVSNRRIHFGGETGVVLGTIPANVTAPDYSFSVYAYSPFFQEMANKNLLELDELGDPDFVRVVEYIRDEVGDYFRDRETEKSGELIQSLKEAGVYPYEGDPKDEIERRERQVFDIATHAVQSYSRDFKKAENALKKIALGLLKEALAHNPESVTRILKAVFNLPKSKQDDFSELLERTQLSHIISASSLIAERVVTLQVLRGMVFDPKHRATIKERGELDVLVGENTWIFGENFHFTMQESGLTKIMARVSDEIGKARPRNAKGRKSDGKIGRIDSFMGRMVPSSQPAHREFLLVELKRPSLKVTRKEIDQLEDYVRALIQQPDFATTATTWNFYLVTTEYDDFVKERVTQKDRPVGLFLDKDNHKVWVKTWADIVRDCEGRLNFIQERLRVEVSAEEIEEKIAALKTSIVKAGKERSQSQDGLGDGAKGEGQAQSSNHNGFGGGGGSDVG